MPAVTVLHADWRRLQDEGPFDLLVLDGGGQGKKNEPPIAPAEWLRSGGLLVLDDFTPSAEWPPTYQGRPDNARLHWLKHPHLLATQIRTQPDAVSIIATFAG